MKIIWMLLSCLLLLAADLPPIVEIPIYYAENNSLAVVYRLYYGNMSMWAEDVYNFEVQYGLAPNTIRHRVKEELERYYFPPEVTEGNDFTPDPLIYSHEVLFVHRDFLSPDPRRYADRIDKPLYFLHNKHQHQLSNPHIDERILSAEYIHEHTSSLVQSPIASQLPQYLRHHHRIIIYQTRFANTGGTMALSMLADTLRELGYDALLCEELNHMSDECNKLTGSEVIVTGEWCKGVLEDHGVVHMRGRGVQYHLGFHHYEDTCSGTITITDSHYLSIQLQNRILGGYYLGCPMNLYIKNRITDVLVQRLSVAEVTVNNTSVLKENLILLDYDYFMDYTPEVSPELIPVPAGYRMEIIRGIPGDQIPLLLQRAKIVIDLALPGPERLAGEAVLMGAVAIVANRWNGVDPMNSSAIGAAIVRAVAIIDATNADTPELLRQGDFYAYILSMWRRSSYTANVVFGSSVFRFVLQAHTSEDEKLCVLQALTLWYLYPLASVDMYVRDVKWFVRDHYYFYAQLKEAGYIRHDMMDPEYRGETSGVSLFRVLSLHRSDDHLPNTNGVAIALASGVVLRQPDELFNILAPIAPGSTVALICDNFVAGVLHTSDVTTSNSQHLLRLLTMESWQVDKLSDIAVISIAALKEQNNSGFMVTGVLESTMWRNVNHFYDQKVG